MDPFAFRERKHSISGKAVSRLEALMGSSRNPKQATMRSLEQTRSGEQ